MGRYIPFDQMSKLREAARNGDEMAKKILHAQLADEEDFSADLDNYFKPKEETKVEEPESVEEAKEEVEGTIEKIGEPIEGQETDRDKFENVIKDLIQDEIDAIDSYSKAITEVMNMPEFNEAQMRRAIARFKEIRQDEEEHVRELNALLKNEEAAE